MGKFIVYGGARGRTAWLSQFLAYGPYVCGHDELRYARALGDLEKWYSQGNVGTVETAAGPWWRLVERRVSELRTLVVRRPVEDELASFTKLGWEGDQTALRNLLIRADAKLCQISHRVKGALTVTFDELREESACKKVFEHCLELPFDASWWAHWNNVNVQVNFPALVRYCQAFQADLAKLVSQAKWQSLRDMALREPISLDGMVINIVSLEHAYANGTELFKEHMLVVGEDPEGFSGKNIQLMRELDTSGHLQVVTAEQNGRMFGYLMTVLGPSMEVPGEVSAMHTTFFASPDAKGLGMRIQRKALAALVERGVREVTWHEGVRGDGPRLGTMYRRLGAEPYGQLYHMQLKG